MDRKDEIKIMIDYLKKDVVDVSSRYPNLLANTIINNGKLIEAYEKELEELKK